MGKKVRKYIEVISGKRTKGRSKKISIDNIREDMKEKNPALDEAQNREAWKRLSKNVNSTWLGKDTIHEN